MVTISKIQSKTNIIRYLSAIAFLFIIFVSYSMATAEIETKSFPLSINIERSYSVKSSMYLRYSFEEYNEPFAKFKTKENSPVANQFKKNLQDIREQKIPKDITLSVRTKIAEGYQSSDIYNQTVTNFNRHFPPEIVGHDFGKMKIIKQIYVGNDRIITWEANSIPSIDGKPFRGSSKFKKNEQGGFVWEVGLSDEVRSLMDEHEGLLRGVEPHNVALIDNVKCSYEYAVVGTDTNYPVYLQFNGKVCDFNVIDGVTDDEVLSFYQQTCQLLAQSPPALADFYTEQSAQWYRSIIEKFPKVADPYLRQRELVNNGRRVVFLLNANPVFIVFYQPFKGKMKFPENIQYDYIIRDPKDNQLRLTNYSYSGSLSQFFDNKNLFVEPFLKPLLEKDVTPK